MKQAETRSNPPKARRVKLQHILFLLLLLPGIVPLVLSSFYLLNSNRETLKVKEKELLTLSAQGFAQLVSEDLAQRSAQLEQLGNGLLAAPGFGNLERRLRQKWANDYVGRFTSQERLIAFRAFNRAGKGTASSNMDSFEQPVIDAMNEAFEAARDSKTTVYRFTLLRGTDTEDPAVAMAVPVQVTGSEDLLILQGLVPVAVRSSAASQAAIALGELFLIDAGGKPLWSAKRHPSIERALLESDLIQGFAAQPVNVTRELELDVDGETQATLVQVVPIPETGWGVVAHKTTEVAFQEVRLVVLRILTLSALAVLLALVLALSAARGFSLPIQRLAEATHEIAAGRFDRRVSTEGLSFEVAELAEDFNRMSDTVESYVVRLQRAAEVNRQLFISSIRAFAAAIDAKDPYTRGHSERVASYSRAIARYLGLPKDMQEKVWISAVLHDVGKIGVEDRVLKKHGVLTPDEFEQMKLHPVIGADIVEPISALRDHLPGIRWHHEAWNGSGYPDGLKGEQIPLMARIIGVADTFDAITTNRPYQTASSPEFALQTIKKLTGTRFDAKIVTAFLLAWEADQIQMTIPKQPVVPPSAPGGVKLPTAAERTAAMDLPTGDQAPSVGQVDAPAPPVVVEPTEQPVSSAPSAPVASSSTELLPSVDFGLDDEEASEAGAASPAAPRPAPAAGVPRIFSKLN